MNRYKFRIKSQSVQVNTLQAESNLTRKILMRSEKVFIDPREKTHKRTHQKSKCIYYNSMTLTSTKVIHKWIWIYDRRHTRVRVKEG